MLKEYLIKGYTINEKRLTQQKEQLKELQESVKILGNVLNYKTLTNDESTGLLKIISDYAYALDILDQYDYQKLEINNTSGKEAYQLTYEEAMKQIKLPGKLMETVIYLEERKIIRSKVQSQPSTKHSTKKICTQALKKKQPIYCTS